MSEELTQNSGSNYSASSIQVLEGLEPFVNAPPCISATSAKKACITWSTR